MTIEQLEGLVNPSFSALQTLTWGTATDWDNAVSEAGVVHEDNALTEWTGSGTIEMGYPTFDRGGSNKVLYWPGHGAGDSSTFEELINAEDASVVGAPVQDGRTGPHGRTVWDFDGSDDGGNTGGSASFFDGSDEMSIAGWAYIASVQSEERYAARDDSSEQQFQLLTGAGSFDWGARIQDDGGTWHGNLSAVSYPSGTWHMVGLTYDGSDLILYTGVPGGGGFDGGTTISSFSIQINPSTNNIHLMHKNQQSDRSVEGSFAETQFWDRALSSSEMQAWYDAGLAGHLETATKSASSSITPDLQNLSYSLNGGSIDLKVIGSPGTASEEVLTQTLDGSTSYSLTWSNSHQDFRLRPEFSLTNVTDATPTFSAGELAG